MKVLLTALIIMGMIANNPQKKEGGFLINGTLKGNVENTEVKIFDAISRNTSPLDSTVVKDGKFQLKGKVEEPGMYQIVFILPDTTLSPYDKNLGYHFYLENSNITFDADATTLTSLYYNPKRKGIPVITGSATHDLNKKLLEGQKDIRKRLSELDKKIMEEYHLPFVEGAGKEDVAAGIRYQTEVETLLEQKNKLTMQFVKENAASPVALDQARHWLNRGNKTAAE